MQIDGAVESNPAVEARQARTLQSIGGHLYRSMTLVLHPETI